MHKITETYSAEHLCPWCGHVYLRVSNSRISLVVIKVAYKHHLLVGCKPTINHTARALVNASYVTEKGGFINE